MAQNTIVLLGGRAGGVILSATSSVLLFRYLGSQLVGRYAALYAYLALFGWLATFGMEAVLAREVSRRRDMAGTILMSAVFGSLGLAIVGIGIALVGAPHLGYGQSVSLLALAAFEILLLAPLRLPAIVLQVDLRQWIAVLITLGRQVLWLALVIVLMVFKAPLLIVVLARALCAAIEVLILFRASLEFLAPGWRLLWAETRAALLQGAPLAVNALSVGIYHRVDQVMLHNVAGDAVLGHYVAAVNIVELLSAIPVAFMVSLFPIISRAAHEQDRFRDYVGQAFRYLMIVACGSSLILSIGSPVLVRLIYGTGFQDSSIVLATLVWSEIPVFWGVVALNAFIALGLQRYAPVSTAIGAVTNLALNWFLIPRFGGLGAAWATVVSYSVGGVLVFLVLRPTRPLAGFGLRMTAVPFSIALALALILIPLDLPPLVKALIAVPVYVLGLYVTKAVGAADMKRIWGAIRPLNLARG